jgi:hypothetical protein
LKYDAGKDGEDRLDWLYGKEEVLHRIKEQRILIHKIKRKKANWMDHAIFTNFLIKRFIKGKIKGKQRRGSRCWMSLKKKGDSGTSKRNY